MVIGRLWLRWDRDLRISTKIALLTGIISAGSAVVIGAMFYQGMTSMITKNAEGQLKDQADINTVELLAEINSLREDIVFLRNTPPIEGMQRAFVNAGIDPEDGSSVQMWLNRLETIFFQLLKSKSHYTEISLINVTTGGKELIKVNKSNGKILSTDPSNLNNIADSAYYQEVLELEPDEVLFSDILTRWNYRNIVQPKMAYIQATIPVYFNGVIVALVKVNMEVGYIFRDLSIFHSSMVNTNVTDSKGRILFNKDPSLNFFHEFGDQINVREVFGGLLASEINRKVLHLHRHEYDYDGDQSDDLDLPEYHRHKVDHYISGNENTMLVYYTQTVYNPGPHQRTFGLLLTSPLDDLMVNAIGLRNKGMILICIFSLLSIVAVALIARRLSRSIDKVTDAAHSFALGYPVGELPIDRRDEVGELAQAFSYMCTQLVNKEVALKSSQSKVLQASKMAALGEMASGIAHEINSPIQAIKLGAERLLRKMKRGSIEEKDQQTLVKMVTAVERASGIINGLRKLARNADDDPFEQCCPHCFVQDAIDMVSEKCKISSINLDVEYCRSASGIKIMCRRLQLMQVIINLLNNAYDAIKDLPEKWIHIQVTAENSCFLIIITDSGNGVPEHIQEKIFEPLFTSKPVGQGTGIGLSISRRIVQDHGGDLQLDTQHSHTCFKLMFDQAHYHQDHSATDDSKSQSSKEVANV